MLTDRESRATGLLKLIRAVAQSLHPGREILELHLDSDLERDAGLDSLGRVELMLRIERHFGVRIPDEAAVSAQYPRQLLDAMGEAGAEDDPGSAFSRMPDISESDGVPVVPDQAQTLSEVLDWHADRVGERPCVTLYESASDSPVLSYRGLREGSAQVAAGLRDRGVGPGDRVALMLPTGLDFFFAFHGVMWAGAVPVPLYPPVRVGQMEDHFHRIAGVVENAGCRCFIASRETAQAGQLLKTLADGLEQVVTVPALRESATFAPRVPRAGQDTAFLQYTSGTTGNPKGVILSHANLLANIRAMGSVIQVSHEDRFVSWLPLYHDMGLIGACLGTMYYGVPLFLMSPLQFMARPQRWLWAIHRHSGTLSAAPNFAYDLCANRLQLEELEGLDLSRWRVAFNGAEPVAERTLKAFQERFGPHGFRQESMKPVYGLAESSVGLTFPPLERPPILDRIKRDAFEEEGEARPAGEDDTQARVFVACGQALPGHDIRVVDDNGRPLPDRRQGSLQFRGPSCTRGYFNNPEATSKLMEDGWLNSGDLAYLDEGELYLTGRVKDMIIRGGRNYYPYELEQAVSAIPGVRRNNVAVFASPDLAGGPERLVVVAETRETDKGERERIREAIVEASVSLMDSAPDVISLQPPQAIPKTSSGKIRRPACRELFESGKLGQEIGMVRQLLHLLAGGFRPLALRALKSMRRGLFALWAWLAGLLLVVPSACLIAGIPGKRWRAGFARRVARLMFLSWGMSLTVRGRDNLPTGSSVLVANHASYLDGAILRAGLPGPLCFVAKRELAGTLAGFLLRRVGAVWVDRSNHRKGLADLDYAMGHLDQGERLMFFPEGTLSAAPGLRDFRIGAFMAAVRKQVPVVPVVIRGSRRALPGNSLLPRPARLIVEVGEPLWAEGDDWDAAIGLRDRTRTWVLAHCGEADIAHGDGGLIGDARQGRL